MDEMFQNIRKIRFVRKPGGILVFTPLLLRDISSTIRLKGK